MDVKHLQRKPELLLKLLSLILMIISIVIMYGWLLKIPFLVQITPYSASMQFNTALCFALSGLALMLYDKNKTIVTNLLSLIIIGISGLTLVEYWYDLNFGLDNFFIEPFIDFKTSSPGRMGPNTAVCFVLFGLFIFLSQIEWHRLFFGVIFFPCVFGILGLISIIGYLFNVQQAYAWGALTPMAIHTAIGFILLSMASFLLLQSKKDVSKKRLSTLFDYTIFSSLLLFFLILWQVVSINYVATLKNEATNQLSLINAKLSVETQRDIEAIIRLFARYSAKSYSNTNAFSNDVNYYFKHMPALTLLHIDTQGQTLTLKNPFIKDHDKKEAINCPFTSKSTPSMALPTINEKSGYLCIQSNEISAAINLKKIMALFLKNNSKNFIISLKHDGKLYYQNTPMYQGYEDFWGKTEYINLYGSNWSITAYPTHEYIQKSIGKIPNLILFLGIAISFLVLFLLTYRRKLIAKEKALLSAEVIKTTILNSTLEGVLGVNDTLQVYFMNKSAQALLGITFDNQKDIPLDELIKTHQFSAEADNILSNIKKSLHIGKSVKENSDIILKNNGKQLSVSYSSSPIIEENDIVGAIIVFADNTERQLYEEKLKALALYDPLTNLPNRFNIISHLTEVIARAKRHQIKFSLCFIDINKFKSINDTHGHHVGDLALQYIANLITSIIRKNDFFGRLSGDEFCLILDKIYLQSDIDNVLKKINDALKTPFIFDDGSLSISLSIGVISYTNENSAEELLIKADEAMYLQKKLAEQN